MASSTDGRPVGVMPALVEVKFYERGSQSMLNPESNVGHESGASGTRSVRLSDTPIPQPRVP